MQRAMTACADAYEAASAVLKDPRYRSMHGSIIVMHAALMLATVEQATRIPHADLMDGVQNLMDVMRVYARKVAADDAAK